MNVLKVTNFVKENNLKLIADNGITITDSIGYVMFDDNNMIKCFENAASMYIQFIHLLVQDIFIYI